MKKGLVLLALAMASCMVTGTAFAGPFGRFGRQHQQQRAAEQNEPRDNEGNAEKDRSEKNAPNSQQPGPAGRDEMRPGGDPGQAQGLGRPFGGRGGARMSIEERQKLRRQINEAGRSLYTPPGNK